NQQRLFASYSADRGFLQLVGRRDPKVLLEWAGRRSDAVDLAMESGDARLALDAVAARGKAMPPVWNKAYTALASLYYNKQAPDASAIYRDLLGDLPIGQRLGKPVDRRARLAGDVWFYFGSRFGEYLALRKAAGADDFIPATLEQHPGQPE